MRGSGSGRPGVHVRHAIHAVHADIFVSINGNLLKPMRSASRDNKKKKKEKKRERERERYEFSYRAFRPSCFGAH